MMPPNYYQYQLIYEDEGKKMLLQIPIYGEFVAWIKRNFSTVHFADGSCQMFIDTKESSQKTLP